MTEIAAGYLPWLWIIGTPLTFMLLTTGVVGAERLRRGSSAITDVPIAECAARIAQSLAIGRRVTVAVCERVAAPVLVGIVRPMILLPPAALTGWSPDEIEMVLLHELAHVRRWDNLVNLGQRIVEAALFFQPAVWLVSRWVRREREACCDAVVVGETKRPQAYAELLVALAAQLPRSVLFHPAATSAMAAGPIRNRIRRVMGIDDDPMLISGKSLGVVMAGLLLAATLAVLNLPTNSRAEESTDAAAAQEGDESTRPEDVADALDDYRKAVVGYDLDFDSVFPQWNWRAYDAERLKRYPIRNAWPDVLGHVDTDAEKFRVTSAKPTAEYTTATGGNAYLVPLSWSLGTKNYATVLFLRGIEADAHVIAHSYTSFACFGPMAGDALFKSYATALVDGDLGGQVTAESYFNLVVTGKFTGRIYTSSYAMIYLMGGLDGEMEIDNSKVYVAGRTTKDQLQKIRGPGKVYLEESDLASGVHKLGDLEVTVKPSAGENSDDLRTQQYESLSNLKELVFAMHKYHDARRRFPPVAAFDSAGKPLLSWRVLLLPYLDEQELYEQFRWDEPWDSEHNRKLIAKMPKVFKNPRIDRAGFTNYLAVVGDDCVFDGTREGIRFADITDGTSKTIALVEADADRAVEWTKPADWQFDREQPKAGLGGLWNDKWLAAWCDARALPVLNSESAETVRMYFTRRGDEVIREGDGAEYADAFGGMGGAMWEETDRGGGYGGEFGRYDPESADPADIDSPSQSAAPAGPAMVDVPFVVGASRFEDGDSIEIFEIRGTANRFERGNVYWIKGKYTLASRDRAQLSAFTTARNAGEGRSSTQKIQTTTIDRGSGEFTLWLPMTVSGWPHVSFYPGGGGDGFGGVYFGTGDSVLERWWSEQERTTEDTEENSQESDDDERARLQRYFSASTDNYLLTKRYPVPPEQHKAMENFLLAFKQDPFGPRVEFEYTWLDESSEIEITAPRAAHDEVFAKMFRKLAEDATTASEREPKSDSNAAKDTDEPSGKSPTAGLEESLEKKISFCVVLFNAPGRDRDLQDLYHKLSQQGRTIYLYGYSVDPDWPAGKRYRLTAEPTCVVFKHGEETARLEGIESKEQLVEFVEGASGPNEAGATESTIAKTNFPTLEEQKLADAIYRRTGLEMVALSPEELRRVLALGYEGGMKITQNDGSVISWETNRGGILPNDILVGLHVWPTTTAAEVVAVLQRDDLAELNPLKFYLIRPDGDPKREKGPLPDKVVTGRIKLLNLPERTSESMPIKPQPPVAANPEVTESRHPDTRTRISPDDDQSELRYNGKTFDQWRTAWQTELSLEKRLEVVKALAAFGASGQGREAAEAILDVANQLDWSFINTETAAGQLKQACVDAFVSGRTTEGYRIPTEAWWPLVIPLYENSADKKTIVTYLSYQLPAGETDLVPKLLELSNENEATRNLALSGLKAIDPKLEDVRVVARFRESLKDADQPPAELRGAITNLFYYRSSSGGYGPQPELRWVPELQLLLFHADPEVRQTARFAISKAEPRDAAHVVESLIESIGTHRNDQECQDAIRALAALGQRATPAEEKLKAIARDPNDASRIAAAVALLALWPDIANWDSQSKFNKLFGQEGIKKEQWDDISRKLKAEQDVIFGIYTRNLGSGGGFF